VRWKNTKGLKVSTAKFCRPYFNLDSYHGVSVKVVRCEWRFVAQWSLCAFSPSSPWLPHFWNYWEQRGTSHKRHSGRFAFWKL